MPRILTECPTNFLDYELLDCGDFEKLERFGKYITIRHWANIMMLAFGS